MEAVVLQGTQEGAGDAGLGRARRMILGSVSRYVADRSRRPVLIIPTYD